MDSKKLRPDSREDMSRRKLGFTIIGEGDSVTVLPIDSELLSSFRRSACRLGSPSALSDDHEVGGWSCPLCSYENVDPASVICSVCGSERGGEEKDYSHCSIEENSSIRSGSIRSIGFDIILEEETNTSPQPKSPHSSQSKLNFRFDPIFENGASIKAKRRSSEKSESSKATTVSLTDLMAMSFSHLAEGESGAWACTKCTYFNQDPLHLTCAVCGESRSLTKASPFHPEASNSSFGAFDNSFCSFGQVKHVEVNNQVISDLESKALDRQSMQDLIIDQSRILSSIYLTGRNESSTAGRPGTEGFSNSNLLEDAQRQLQASQAVITRIERVLQEERREQQVAEEAQRRVRSQTNSSGHGNYDNLTLAPPMERAAQEQMLHDWRNNREVREHQLEMVRLQQAQLLERFAQYG